MTFLLLYRLVGTYFVSLDSNLGQPQQSIFEEWKILTDENSTNFLNYLCIYRYRLVTILLYRFWPLNLLNLGFKLNHGVTQIRLRF